MDTPYDSQQKRLEDRIVAFIIDNEPGIRIEEQCDCYFSERLTREEFLAFIEELQELAKSVK